MTHGWLPSDAFDLLTRRVVVIEAPLAPEGHLYLAGIRFHFDELRTKGKGIFDSDIDGLVVRHQPSDDACDLIQEYLLMNLSDKSVQGNRDDWLKELKTRLLLE